MSDQALYSPQSPENSATFRFKTRVNSEFGLSLSTYHDLWKWSTAHIDKFWSLVWDDTGVIGDKGTHVVDIDSLPSGNPVWFGPIVDISPAPGLTCLSVLLPQVF